jgi:hypothetical protein
MIARPHLLVGVVTTNKRSARLSTPDSSEKSRRGCSANPPPKLSFGQQLIRVYGDTAINSGTYAFAVVIQSQPHALPARYSFTYRKVDGQWLIADHLVGVAIPTAARCVGARPLSWEVWRARPRAPGDHAML